ncbi:MAG: tetratricopeptide repeat protein [Caldilineaceae bacterium]
MLKISLFGAPQITLDENPIAKLTGKKAPALLMYLAIIKRVVTRDTLANLFWPNVESALAKKNLRDLLSLLRRAVDDYLIVTPHTIAFNRTQPYWVDVEQFYAVLESADPETPLATLRTTLDLYVGEFLEGFHIDDAPLFEEWVLLQRERLQKLAEEGFYLLAERYLAQGEYQAGLFVTQRALMIDPTNERFHRQQMLLLLNSGQPGAALAHYAICRRVMADELGVEPAWETTALAEQIRAGTLEKPSDYNLAWWDEEGRSLPVALPAPPPLPRHNLPRQLTDLIGRQMEITTICTKLLAPNCAWLTLVGEGGIGKTRLALAVGEALLPQFRDGVWFISLADLAPNEDLANQIAAAIGRALRLTFTGLEPVTEQLLAHLQDKAMLLILDNFEHLADDAAFVLALLRATRALKVLVTSRQRLNFQAEHLFRLDGLPVPEKKETQSLSLPQLLEYPSLNLFVQRATQISPDFALTEANWRPIVNICQFLDGWPLGIELAATLTGEYSCTQIAEEIQRDYTRLATTLSDLPVRQQSSQAVFNSSWRLLTPEETRILAQCAVFRGSFTREAAAIVTGATSAILRKLEDKSLLYQPKQGRFAMHELLQRYAVDQLQAMPALAQQVYAQHSDYFIQLLHLQEETFRQGARALHDTLEELDNIRAAWRFAVEQARVNALFIALKPLARLYALVGLHHEAATLFDHAVVYLRPRLLADANVAPLMQHLLAQLVLEQADFCIKLAQMTQAQRLIEEAQKLVPQLADTALEASTHQRLGDVAWAQGDYVLHRLTYEKVLALARTGGMQQLEAHALSNLGMNYDLHGDYPQAIACYQAALSIAQQNEYLHQVNVIYNNLGVSYGMLGDFTSTQHYYEQTLRLSRQLGDQEGIAFAYLNLGALFNKLGAWEEAKVHLQQAYKRFQHLRNRRLTAKTRINLGLLAYHVGDNSKAEQHCQQALRVARKHHFRAVEAEAFTVLGLIFTKQQNLVAAIDAYTQAQNLWYRLGREAMALFAKAGIAQVLCLSSKGVDARRLAEEIWAAPMHSTLNALQEPGFVFLTCYRILSGQDAAPASEVLQAAFQMVQTQAATLSDPELCRSFLEQMPCNREIMALARSCNLAPVFA